MLSILSECQPKIDNETCLASLIYKHVRFKENPCSMRDQIDLCPFGQGLLSTLSYILYHLHTSHSCHWCRLLKAFLHSANV